MPLKTRGQGRAGTGLSAANPLLDEPPLGHLQALILDKLDELGTDAFGYRVLEELSLEAGNAWIDPATVYGTLRSLKGKHRYIEKVGTRVSPRGGPPMKIYRVTQAGRAALKATWAHHRALTAWSERPRMTRKG